jgi:small subunit ribosomal protein S9
MVAIKKDKVTGQALGTGRRKSAVARVRIAPGSGKVTVNGKDIKDYFPLVQDQNAIYSTLEVVGKRKEFDIAIRVLGGGTTGQSGACKMGLARALCSYDTELFQPLRDNGFMTRDSRMKERKKPGLHGARRGTQFSKR